MLTVALLGPVELRRDGQRIPLPGGKTTELLARLALDAGGSVRSERLIEDLWGDDAVSTGRNTLQSKVSQLRRALADPTLVTGGSAGYSLAIPPSSVDLLEVLRLADLTTSLIDAGDHSEAVRVSSAARAMFRGEILADVGDAEWLRPHRIRLADVHERLIEDEMAARLELGAGAELIGDLEALVARHPLRERLRAQLMVALYRAGRQADALRAYQHARTVLGDELGLDPGPELQRLEAAILNHDPDLERGADSPRPGAPGVAAGTGGNLPAAVSSFVGRSPELTAIADLVSAHRLVTLVGPGGAGKTRLALEAAGRAQADVADGVWLIELAPLRSGAEVAGAAAAALGLDDSDRLDRFVAQRQLLLVLDNCEHVVDEAASLAERLLRAGAGVTVLATSRERLGATGEALYPVQPLHPDDAVQLFLERARAGGVEPPTDQAETIDRICDQLDRLPLALELAAARTRSLSLAEIADRVDDRFGLLTGGARTAQPRHQTLRGVVDWSYELLFSDEQRLFRRMSVFAGGFGLEAAEAVGASDDLPRADILDLMGKLVDKSLVTRASHGGQTRYTLLRTLADYGRAQLQAAGEEAATSDRHLAWIVDFATAAEPALRTTSQVTWVERVARERDNIRTALAWATQNGRADEAVTIASGLAYGWYISGSIKDSLPLITGALNVQGDVSDERRALAHAWAGWMTQLVGGASAEAVDHVEQAVSLGRRGSARTFAVGAVFASLLRAFRGSTTEAIDLIDEAAARFDTEPDAWGLAWVDWVRSGLLLKAGDPARAAALLRNSVAGFMSEGDHSGAAVAAIRLGELAELRGDYDEATSSTLLAYNGVMIAGDRSFNASVLATRLGNLAALQGDFADAATWHETALHRAREGEFPGAIAQALSGLGEAARRRGDLDAAEVHHREALGLFRASGSVEGAVFTLVCLGLLATARGDAAAARDLHLGAVRAAVASGDRRGVAMAVEGLADAHAAMGDAEQAAALIGAADALRDEIGGAPPIEQRACVDRAEAHARSELGADQYHAAHERGRSTADETVAALAGLSAPPTSPARS